MTDNKDIQVDLMHDYEIARQAKEGINAKIVEWLELYEGAVRTPSGKTESTRSKRSKMVVKEIAKLIEQIKPNITEPLMSVTSPIKIIAQKGARRQRIIRKWATYQFQTSVGIDDLIEEMVGVMLKEGTVWTKTSWEQKLIEEVEEEEVKTEEGIALAQMDKTIEFGESGNPGTVIAIMRTTNVVRDNPKTRVVKNEYMFPDPMASSLSDARFIATKNKWSVSDMMKMELFEEAKISGLLKMIIDGQRVTSDALETTRSLDARGYGQNNSKEVNDDIRKKITIIEYFGEYQVTKGEPAVEIVAYWAPDYEKFLLIKENNFAKQVRPFTVKTYSKQEFSIWGNALAYFIKDNQKAKTGIMRGIMDNMAGSNNGQKFFSRGAIDYVNMKKLERGEKNIFVERIEGIKDGAYNQLPGSVFNVKNDMERESQELAGIDMRGGTMQKNQNKELENQMLSPSQLRMIALARKVSSTWSDIVSLWITMASEIASEASLQEILFGEGADLKKEFELAHKAKVKVEIVSEASRNMKIAQLNMLMQGAKTMEKTLPPGTVQGFYADMMEALDRYEEAEIVRQYQPQPNPIQVKMQQIEVKKAELENAKLTAEIQNETQNTQSRSMEAEARLIDAKTNQSKRRMDENKILAETQDIYKNSKGSELAMGQVGRGRPKKKLSNDERNMKKDEESNNGKV